MTLKKLQTKHKWRGSVLEVCDAANNDYNDVRKKFTDISSIININFFIYFVT